MSARLRSELVRSILASVTFTYLLGVFSFSTEVSVCPSSSNKLDFFTYFVFDVHSLDSVAWFTKVSGSLSLPQKGGLASEGVFSIGMSAACQQRNARSSV